LNAIYIAIGCYGGSTANDGLVAYIANSCVSSSGNGGISHPYNMP